MKFFCVPLFACRTGVVDTVDYSQQRLEEVPREILKSRKHLEELLLNVNGIEELPVELFRCLKLQRLDLSENRIKILPSEIGALQLMTDLNLSKNELVELPDEIGLCRSLQHLNISTNNIPGLPKSIINLSQLTSLNVSNNSLTQLPQDIDLLSNLQLLDAGECQLRFVPPTIVNLNKLKLLNLYENFITELPENLSGLTSLEILDLQQNQLSHLPEGILMCKNLRTLELDNNSLTALPSNLGDLANLTEISICKNQLTTLPSSIGQLKKLEILKASNNLIYELTPAICSCSALTDLILADNRLEELPSSLGNLRHLKFLDVNVNNLQNIPTTIGGCLSLSILSLRRNKLQQLPMEIGRLERLQVLDLIDNNLAYLPYTITVLYQYKTLSALWLSFNQPPLPKLSVTHEPVMNMKVLTCYLLPQKSEKEVSPRNYSNKSCVGGARVKWASANKSAEDLEDEEEKKLPIGHFERYDTPHPKPFAAKNRFSRSSGDFTGIVSNDSQSTQPNSSTNSNPIVVEQRQLRSVLKRRPQSTISLISYGALDNKENIENEMTTKHLIKIKRNGRGFEWCILGGIDSPLYNGKPGVFISQILENGISHKAGFRKDDKILSVNSTDVNGLTHSEIVELLTEKCDEFDILVERLKSSSESTAKLNSPEETVNGKLSNCPSFTSIPSISEAQYKDGLGIPLTASEIISVTINRKTTDNGSPGFTICGTGQKDDPVRISELAQFGAAWNTGKLQVNDRLLSINGVNVKFATHDQVVTLLTSNLSNEIYLVVERQNEATKTETSATPKNSEIKSQREDADEASQIAARLAKKSKQQMAMPTTMAPQLPMSRSMPSLVQDDILEGGFVERLAPPIPPPRIDNNSRLLKHQKNRHAPVIKSMSNLLVDINNGDYQMDSFNPKISAFSQVKPKSQQNPAKVPNANGPMDYSAFFNNNKMIPGFEKPLATSSPIPKSQIPIMNGSASTSTSKLPPPPVAPKPKIILEKLDFSSKLKKFEEQSQTKKSSPLLASNGGVKTGIPMKKPLISHQDLEKLKAEEANKRTPEIKFMDEENAEQSTIDEREAEDAVLELSNDACFNQLLRQGPSSSSFCGPAIIRTRNAEIRAEKFAAAKALGESPNASTSMNSARSTPTCNGSFTYPAPDDISFISSRGASPAMDSKSLEQRKLEMEKRQKWRQARLQSMDVESKRTDEVIKLITSIPSSPIPIQ